MINLTDDPTLDSLPDKVIHFPFGLPGFPDNREFVMAQTPEERPFAWLQSVSDPNLVFAVVDAYAWVKDFSIEVDDSALQEMGSLNPKDYAVYFILRIQQEGGRTLLQAKPNAPLLVNIHSRQARQVIVSNNSSLEQAEALCLQL